MNHIESMEIVDFSKCKSVSQKVISFEMDLFLQIMRVLSIQSVQNIGIEITASNVIDNEFGQMQSITYTFPIIYDCSFKEMIMKIDEISDPFEKAIQYEKIIVQYAIVSTNSDFFHALWEDYGVVSGRYIFELQNQETMRVGPFKLIDFVRDL